LHEQLADWLDRTTHGMPGEFEEIVGYHLEQAHRALVELAPRDERAAALAERMAQRLGAAGERAFARGDMPAAVNLLSRVTDVLPAHHPRRLELLPELAFALLETADFERLGAVAGELTDAAAATADVALQAHATIIGLWIRLFTSPDGWAPEAEREARSAIATFSDRGDERGIARGWSLLGLVGMLGSQFGPAEQAWSRAVDHAERAGSRREALEGLTWLAAAVWLGPTPAEEGIRRCREVFGRAQGDRKAMATALFAQAGLEAGLGRFAPAQDLLARARALLGEVALPVWDAGALSQALGWALLLEGRPAEAEAELRRACDALREIGEVSFLSTVAGMLAEAVLAQGRVDEAAELTRESEAAAGEGDLFSQVVWRSVRARCLARQGDTAAALEVARAGVRLVEQTDCLDLHWRAHLSEAEVLRAAGRHAEAHAAAERAVDCAERKQASVGAELARAALHGLVAAPRPART
jgi:tetratricopeptide (TPR) repeat protein